MSPPWDTARTVTAVEGYDKARPVSKCKRSLHGGNRSVYADAEDFLFDYILARRDVKAVVTVRSVVETLRELRPDSQEKPVALYNLPHPCNNYIINRRP